MILTVIQAKFLEEEKKLKDIVEKHSQSMGYPIKFKSRRSAKKESQTTGKNQDITKIKMTPLKS